MKLIAHAEAFRGAPNVLPALRQGEFMFGLGVQELVIILIIALVVFGPSKLPQIGSGLGKAIRDFRKAVGGDNAGDAKDEDAKKRDGNELPR
jgi:sec-independent protein translocase protein TatA